MRTFLYSRKHPAGVIFSDDGSDPGVPRIPDGWRALGWTENRAEVQRTQDEMMEAVVREEYARRSKDRDRLEAEYTDKTGDIPHFASKDKTLISVLDDNRARERQRPKK